MRDQEISGRPVREDQVSGLKIKAAAALLLLLDFPRPGDFKVHPNSRQDLLCSAVCFYMMCFFFFLKSSAGIFLMFITQLFS